MNSKVLRAATATSLTIFIIFAYHALDGLALGGIVTTSKAAIKPKQVTINLDKSLPIFIPSLKDNLQPVRFKTKDGKQGWALRVVGGRPIATPAYWNGLIFVGGGYGSHEFYAFDANTGTLKWKVHTGDDGPTAAVVENGCVAFNTESCTVYVLDAMTGRTVWQEWLGDPLMSQPAIAQGRLYMAHPAGQAGHHQAQQVNNTVGFNSKNNSQSNGMSHRLLCADLKTGRHLWDKPIPADVITCPVIEDGRVYATCFDGTSLCFDALSGAVKWTKKSSATSAPLAVKGQLVITQKESQGNKLYEGIRRLDSARGKEEDKQLLAKGPAQYLSSGGGRAVAALSKSIQSSLDTSVGFAAAPQAANLAASSSHLGVNTVVAGWAYQGARAAYSKGQIINAQGTSVNSMRSKDAQLVWRAEAKGRNIDSNQQLFLPPALGKNNLYVCSAQGHVISVRQQDGQVEFVYSTNEPITFQPALADGNIYAGTANGMLICLKTGNKDADGWTAWGGNAQHNKSN